jgi:hypothetical protein
MLGRLRQKSLERNDADFVVRLGYDCNLDVYDFPAINAQWIINPIIKKVSVHLLKERIKNVILHLSLVFESVPSKGFHRTIAFNS